ncbi:MAG: hypothetical protein LUI60_02935 [Clostridia bacterium]|nr:hypothetical protein [Clostridia bacterium]
MIKVKDVIILALNMLDRADVAEAMDAETLTDEQTEVLNTLLHCFNSVEDELARSYFPVAALQDVSVTDGKFYFTGLDHTPVKIIGVTSGGKRVKYRLTPQYIQTNAANITVEYNFCPDAKDLGGESDYDGICFGGRLMAYGVAAEYCLIRGGIEESQGWESKYSLAIEGARKLSPARRYIPPRRWA